MPDNFKQVVYAGNFYQCKTQRAISSKIREQNRYTVLHGILRDIGEHMQNGSVDSLLETIKTSYKDEWFPYSSVKEQIQKDDLSAIERMLGFVGDENVIGSSRAVCIETPNYFVNAMVNFITVASDGQYYAYVLRSKKADKSPGGKSVHTNSETDLSCMVAKGALEKEFPNIKVRLVFLFNDEDSLGKIGRFNVLKTKKSNVFTSDYSSYYEGDGSFSFEAFYGKVESVINTKVQPNCFNCDSKDLCQQNTIKTVNRARAKDEAPAPDTYVMPSFTESQMEVINKIDGAMLVCAGPGSGKTATVVGRIKNLIDKGVPAEFILAITFTREAAYELIGRCRAFCKSGSLPEIMTLNALGYKILKLNPEYVGKVTLMSQRDRYTLINSLLDVGKPLEGFSYNVVKGNNGLLSQVDKALIKLSKEGTGDFKPDFLQFAETFNAAVKEHGYISFDDQITLAQKLFDEHPEILKSISNRYQYIMVDEFQDIDDAQAKFIYSLSSSFRNICCVGDDDQSIYAFRGGTNKYMLHFKRLYPDAEIVTLKENFRSTEKIIAAANKQIAENKRLKKDVCAVKKGGIEPVHIASQDKEALEEVVARLHDAGTAYEDIAVIASKNATLEQLEREVAFPSVLGKEYLVNSAFFKIMYFSLKRIYCPSEAEKCKVYLDEMLCDSDVSEKILSLDTSRGAVFYAENLASMLDLQESAVLSAILSVITKNHCKNCKDLYEVFQYMSDFGDEQRIEPDTMGRVIFITSHESKGMEWKVVLMVDDYRQDERSEEQNRLIYVAMTRAKDELYVFDNAKGASVAA